MERGLLCEGPHLRLRRALGAGAAGSPRAGPWGGVGSPQSSPCACAPGSAPPSRLRAISLSTNLHTRTALTLGNNKRTDQLIPRTNSHHAGVRAGATEASAQGEAPGSLLGGAPGTRPAHRVLRGSRVRISGHRHVRKKPNLLRASHGSRVSSCPLARLSLRSPFLLSLFLKPQHSVCLINP